MAAKIIISVEGGKITVTDKTTKAWRTYISILETLARKLKTKTTTMHFEAPDIVRGLLDAVQKEELEKKYKIIINEGMSDVPLKSAEQIIESAKGFDIAVRIDAIDLIFFHTGKLEILSDLKLAASILSLLQLMFRSAKVI